MLLRQPCICCKEHLCQSQLALASTGSYSQMRLKKSTLAYCKLHDMTLQLTIDRTALRAGSQLLCQLFLLSDRGCANPLHQISDQADIYILLIRIKIISRLDPVYGDEHCDTYF
jgi:hypothetical protein